MAAAVFVSGGRAAKKPNLEGCASRREARYSFVSRARAVVSSSLRLRIERGTGQERIECMMLLRCMKPRVRSRLQGGARKPWIMDDSTKSGGRLEKLAVDYIASTDAA